MWPTVGYQDIWDTMLAELHFPKLDDGYRRDPCDRSNNQLGLCIRVNRSAASRLEGVSGILWVCIS